MPLRHAPQAPPPQSTSVSVPFLTPSVQVGAAHLPLEQTPLVQSLGTLHFLVSAHLGQVAPPQSTSVSAPFCLLSVQVGGGRSGTAESGCSTSTAVWSTEASTAASVAGGFSSSHPRIHAVAAARVRAIATRFIGSPPVGAPHKSRGKWEPCKPRPLVRRTITAPPRKYQHNSTVPQK